MPSQTKKLRTPRSAMLATLATVAALLFVPAAGAAPAGQAQATPALDGLVHRGQLTQQDADVLAALLAREGGGFTPQERDGLQALLDRLGAAASVSEAPSLPALPDLPYGPTLAQDVPCTQCVKDFVSCVLHCVGDFVNCLADAQGPTEIAVCVREFVECLLVCIDKVQTCLHYCTIQVDVVRQAPVLGRVASVEPIRAP